MAQDREIIYEPHPVTPERKAELVKKGYRIIDAAFAPEGSLSPSEPKQEDDGFDADAARAYLTGIGVSFHPNMGAKKLQELYEKHAGGKAAE